MSFIGKLVITFFEGFLNEKGKNMIGKRLGTSVEWLCQENGWDVDERYGPRSIGLLFKDPIFKARTVLVSWGEEIVVIGCQSHFKLRKREFDESIGGYLLRRNKELNCAAWRMGDTDDGHIQFDVSAFAQLNSMQPKIFKFLCEQISKEVINFDQRLHAEGLLRI